MKNKIKSKKAQLMSAYTDFAGYGAFVIVLLVFIFLFGLTEKHGEIENTIATNFISATSQHSMLNYLKRQLVFEEENITMADYIIIKYERNEIDKLKDELKSDLMKYVDNSELECFTLRISDSESSYSTSPLIWITYPQFAYPTICIDPFIFNPIRIPTKSGKTLLIGLGTSIINKK